MKLLFDENLSFRLPTLVGDVYAGSAHVRTVGLKGADDADIWTYAAAHGFVVVSKDADFYQRSLLLRSPPKVVWLRIGNAPRARSQRSSETSAKWSRPSSVIPTGRSSC